jgi:xanthine dehydrogenase/oxidase
MSSVLHCPTCSTRLLPQSSDLKCGVYTGDCTVCGRRIRFRSAAVAAGVTEHPVRAVSFSVNGAKYVLEDIDPVGTLGDWLKEQAGLKGTKTMCKEGGCGACVVALTRKDTRLQKRLTMAITSVRISPCLI